MAQTDSLLKATPLDNDVLLLEPRVFGDERGFFFESFNQRRFESIVGRKVMFVQDNHSRSAKNVLRGLHYQVRQPQGKLIRVLSGEIFDVAVDLRRSSPRFGQAVSAVLSAANKNQLWIPEGYAHGFLVVSDYAEVAYKTTDYYAPEHERCLAWNDPRVAIAWPLSGPPILSARDGSGASLADADVFMDSLSR